MVKLKCPRCGRSWGYRGTLVLATYPSCYKKVRVKECKVK